MLTFPLWLICMAWFCLRFVRSHAWESLWRAGARLVTRFSPLPQMGRYILRCQRVEIVCFLMTIQGKSKVELPWWHYFWGFGHVDFDIWPQIQEACAAVNENWGGGSHIDFYLSPRILVQQSVAWKLWGQQRKVCVFHRIMTEIITNNIYGMPRVVFVIIVCLVIGCTRVTFYHVCIETHCMVRFGEYRLIQHVNQMAWINQLERFTNNGFVEMGVSYTLCFYILTHSCAFKTGLSLPVEMTNFCMVWRQVKTVY